MAKSKSKSVKKKSGFNKKEFGLFMLVFAIVGAFTLWVSFAAPANKGGGGTKGGSGTITGPVMVTDLNGDGLPNHKDTVDFTITTFSTQTPEVGLRCYQGSAFVYDGYKSYWASADPSFKQPFTLDSGYWQSGLAANCTARLFYNDKRGNQIVLTTLSFNVNP